MALTRLGFHFSNMTYEGVDERGLWDRIAAAAVAAEASGFDSLWVPDHVHQNPIGGGPSGPMPEAYLLLAALAARTERVRLGALVSPVTFRSPALLAKMAATLDVISRGRAVLGLGAGWDAPEHAAYGIDFPDLGEREDRLEETAQLCRAMLSSSPASWAGEHYRVESAWNAPRPVQDRLPILIGGGGERRTLRAVARYGDACNFFGDPSALAAKLDVLRQHCDREGRDFAEISTTSGVAGPGSADEVVDAVGRLREAGVEGAVVFGSGAPDPDAVARWGQAVTTAFP